MGLLHENRMVLSIGYWDSDDSNLFPGIFSCRFSVTGSEGDGFSGGVQGVLGFYVFAGFCCVFYNRIIQNGAKSLL